MSIEHKVQLVEELFGRLENEITNFKSETNLHCLTGCGQCCSKPNIDASPLEFLPWAFYLIFKWKSRNCFRRTKYQNQYFLSFIPIAFNYRQQKWQMHGL